MRLVKMYDLTRIGRNYDGGYVISESLMKNSSVLLSFGINDDWSFEEDFYRRSGIGCTCFDFSVSESRFFHLGLDQIRFFFGDIIKRRTIKWSRWKTAWDHFEIYRRFKSFFRRHQFFCLGIATTTHGQFKTLDDILREHVKQQNNIFLKIDIEGDEYRIVDDIIRNKHRFHALAMEVHNIHDDNNDFETFLAKLQQGFHVYHIHANNYGSIQRKLGMPDVIEISCIRKDLVRTPIYYDDMSHLPLTGIDFPNNVEAADYKWDH